MPTKSHLSASKVGIFVSVLAVFGALLFVSRDAPQSLPVAAEASHRRTLVEVEQRTPDHEVSQSPPFPESRELVQTDYAVPLPSAGPGSGDAAVETDAVNADGWDEVGEAMKSWSAQVLAGTGDDAVPPAPPLALDEPEIVAVEAPASTLSPAPSPAPTSPPAPRSAVRGERTITSAAEAGPDEPIAPVVVPQVATGPSRIQRGEAALGRISFPLSSIGYTVSFHPPSLSYRGLTFTRRRHIEIYVRPSMSDAELTYVIAHEMGHAVDHIRNDLTDRANWRSARGMSPTLPWWPTDTGSDLATPAGDFAECFASWVAGSASHSTWGSCAGTQTLLSTLAFG